MNLDYLHASVVPFHNFFHKHIICLVIVLNNQYRLGDISIIPTVEDQCDAVIIQENSSFAFIHSMVTSTKTQKIFASVTMVHVLRHNVLQHSWYAPSSLRLHNVLAPNAKQPFWLDWSYAVTRYILHASQNIPLNLCLREFALSPNNICWMTCSSSHRNDVLWENSHINFI